MSLLFRAVDLFFWGRSADSRKFLHDTLLVHGVISPIAQSQSGCVCDLVMPALGAVLICFFTERHSLLTQVAFMSFTRHCFFRSQVYRGLSGRHCLGTPPRPLVTPTSSAAELPFEGQSVGAADVAASEQASPRFAEAGGAGDLSHRRRQQ